MVFARACTLSCAVVAVITVDLRTTEDEGREETESIMGKMDSEVLREYFDIVSCLLFVDDGGMIRLYGISFRLFKR